MIKFIGPDGMFPSIEQSTIEEALLYLSDKKVIGLDSETEGFDPHSKKIVMLQLGDKDNQFIIDTRFVNIEPFRDILESREVVKVGHNIKFDYKFLKKADIELENIYDTMVSECLIYAGVSNIEYSLDSLCDRYKGIKLDKSVRNQFINLKGKPFTDKQIVYGADDIIHLLDIREEQIKIISKMDMIDTLNLENECVLAIGDIEYNGMKVDSEKWLEVANLTESNAIEYEKRLDNIVINEPLLSHLVPKSIQSNLFGYEERLLKINWGSPIQVLHILKDLGLDIKSTDSRELKLVQNRHSLVKELINYKKQQKLAESFGRNFLKFINPYTGRIHQDIWQVVSTGRMSSSEPNLTNIPAKGEIGKKIRACFIPEDNKFFVGGDFAGCELRIIADKSGEQLWIDEFNGEGKVHDKVACSMFNIEMSQVKECPDWLNGASYRDVSKTISFGLAYGMSEFKLANTLQIDIKIAKELINKYFENLPRIKSFLSELGLLGLSKGYSRTFPPFNRIRQYPKWADIYPIIHKDKFGTIIKVSSNEPNGFKILGEVEREAKNAPIQGSNGDLTKYSLVQLRRFIKDNNLSKYIFLVNVIHDEIITECDNEELSDWWKIRMSEIMTNSGKMIVQSIPMNVDCKKMKCWEK